MPTYLIERTVPCAGQMSDDELRALAASSNEVLRTLDGAAQWCHSYVTDDKIVCIYEAAGDDVVREHARQGGFPIDEVHEVRATIGPHTAAAAVAR